MLKRNCQLYCWQGQDAQGNSLNGEIKADTKSDAKVMLLKQGITVHVLSGARQKGQLKGVEKKAAHLWRRRPGTNATMVMLEQLASLTRAGLPINKALEICTASCTDGSLQQILRTMNQDVTNGSMLHQTMEKHPECFERLTINLLKAGELTGQLDAMLKRVVSLSQHQLHTRQQLRQALRYPTIVLMTAIVVCGILLTQVVPGFADSFSQFGAELPWLTQHVMSVSDFAIRHGLSISVGLATALVSTRLIIRRTARGTQFWHRLIINAPLIGPTIRAACISRLCNTLTVALRSGLPLVEALQLSAPTVGNEVYQNAVNSLLAQVSQGNTLSSCIRKTGLFPVMIEQMATVGEEVGTLDSMLDKCAAHYQQVLDSRIAQFTASLEPCLMAFLGIVIGILMLAMYLPVFTLGSAI